MYPNRTVQNLSNQTLIKLGIQKISVLSVYLPVSFPLFFILRETPRLRGFPDSGLSAIKPFRHLVFTSTETSSKIPSGMQDQFHLERRQKTVAVKRREEKLDIVWHPYVERNTFQEQECVSRESSDPQVHTHMP